VGDLCKASSDLQMKKKEASIQNPHLKRLQGKITKGKKMKGERYWQIPKRRKKDSLPERDKQKKG